MQITFVGASELFPINIRSPTSNLCFNLGYEAIDEIKLVPILIPLIGFTASISLASVFYVNTAVWCSHSGNQRHSTHQRQLRSHYRGRPMKNFRIGQIIPSSNTTMETEIPAMLTSRCSLFPEERFTFHSSRTRRMGRWFTCAMSLFPPWLEDKSGTG